MRAAGWSRRRAYRVPAAVILAAFSQLLGACTFIERVSVSSTGSDPIGAATSLYPSVSSNGRYVAFASDATNLASNDHNGVMDIYVRDNSSATTSLVSVNMSGSAGNGSSTHTSISADGRYVAFLSSASDLVSGDTNSHVDVFVRDLTAGATQLVDVAAGGGFADGDASEVTLSSDGRYVAFTSEATNLVAGDTNGVSDVFVRDLQLQVTERESISGGVGANAGSVNPAISQDDRWVAFASGATNLDANPTGGTQHIYVRDRQTGTIDRADIPSGGGVANNQADDPSLSADGRYVSFTSFASNLVANDANGTTDLFVRDRTAGTTELESVNLSGAAAANGADFGRISADGRFVEFESNSSDLVVNDTNGTFDVFIRDRTAATTQRVSVGSTGAQFFTDVESISMSPDSRFVVFGVQLTDYPPGVNLYERDRILSVTGRVDVGSSGSAGLPVPTDEWGQSLSADGRYVIFSTIASNLVANDTNSYTDVFRRDRTTGTVIRVNLSGTGQQADQTSQAIAISSDGRYVVFSSWADNLVTGDTNATSDIFVRDTQNNTTERVNIPMGGGNANGVSYDASISSDGRYVAFNSLATNLVPGTSGSFSRIYVRDRTSATTTLASQSSGGVVPNDVSYEPRISSDGRYIAFSSYATNLVVSDTNASSDIFVRDTMAGTTERVSVASDGTQANDSSYDLSISADGRYVAFSSSARNFDPANWQGTFVRDRLSNTTTRVSVSNSGEPAGAPAGTPSISGDGRYIAFQTTATNLVAGVTNGLNNVYVRDQAVGVTTLVSKSIYGTPGDGGSGYAALSGDGRYIAFDSSATNLASVSTKSEDVYVAFVATPTITTITPAAATHGSSTTITIQGSGFLPNAIVGFNVAGITVVSVTLTDTTHLSVNIAVAANTTAGPSNVVIANPGTSTTTTGAAGACLACFTIT